MNTVIPTEFWLAGQLTSNLLLHEQRYEFTDPAGSEFCVRLLDGGADGRRRGFGEFEAESVLDLGQEFLLRLVAHSLKDRGRADACQLGTAGDRPTYVC